VLCHFCFKFFRNFRNDGENKGNRMGEASRVVYLHLRAIFGLYHAVTDHHIDGGSCCLSGSDNDILFCYCLPRCKRLVIQPGVYVGKVEPNHEDVELSVIKEEGERKKRVPTYGSHR
jgi:hypothetical protein